MIQTTATHEATKRQTDYIVDLAARRPGWKTTLDEKTWQTVFNVLANDRLVRLEVIDPELTFISKIDASAAIDALRKIMPQQAPTLKQVASKFIALQELLRKINPGRYALPRVADGEVDFFEVVEREGENGVVTTTRWVNRLLGSPGDWNRDRLSVDLQAAAGRAISGDQVAAARLYADSFQTCPRCDAPLSHPRSRAAKIGHDCAKAWGWKW